MLNPFTPESDQCQNSPAASQEIWHHTVWRTWLFIAYSDEKWLYYKFSLHHSYNRFLKGWENTLFELRSERVKVNNKATLLSWFVHGIIPKPFHSQVQKSTFSQPFKEKCVSEVVRIGSVINFHPSKLWKARFSILCDVICLVRLQEIF